MAILSYTTADGTVVKVNSYKVNNLVPVQTKGDNPNAVMSQKAVTDEVNALGLQIDEATGKITALTSTVNTKANINDVYTKTEANGKFLTASDITGKANKTDLTTEINRATAKEKELSDRITALNDNTIIDCGEY